ncbi:tryptophan--tRNA ligase [Candidatus Peregrinibacteria bacterium CG11_big_fil_rev_8_21_14_0_20_46_8]|nr:MAG: tryptophan--tRNA ligase [Candidatus Peregrinibacteria bacterium CG11_big_fil_rev_8_21_14_0_20_46_8]
MKRILSGMQPSGKPHLGNYLGAMRQHVAMQEQGECYYFVANYHALTTVRDGARLKSLTLELVMDYLALGIDPTKTTFFLQSDVPSLTELTWIFSTITPMGLLERAHAWKDAQAKKKKDPTAGLFIYPVLMACDILMYKPNLVPVGKDQKQHVEIARDIASYFNNTYGDTFPMPEPVIHEETAVVPGTDGQKMSKSYGNTIEIFAPADELKKQIFSIKTDSAGVDDPKDPNTCIPFLLLKHFLNKEEGKEAELRLQTGGVGYAELKKNLFEKMLAHFAEARDKRLELEKKKDYCVGVLEEGKRRANALAQATMEEVREKTGLTL